MPLDQYLFLGRNGPQRTRCACGAITFVEDPGPFRHVERTLASELAPQVLDQGMALLPGSPLKGGFVFGKYRRAKQLAQPARADCIGGPAPRQRQPR
jgi:aryl-alcohol dehydrogenase-like predicted oxidoreductase